MNAPQDEATLIARARRGERAALATLHDRYYRAMYMYFATRVESPQAAEDLTSEVFVRMVQNIHRFRDIGKPILAWLYTIARNLLMDYHRSHQGPGAALSLNEQWASAEGSPEQMVESNLAADCLRKALQHITEEQKLVIVGKFLEGRSNRDIARLLDKTEGAVKSLQHRALAALRRAIKQEGCYET